MYNLDDLIEVSEPNWKGYVVSKYIDPYRLRTFYVVNCVDKGANYTWDYIIDNLGYIWYAKIRYSDEFHTVLLEAIEYYDKWQGPIEDNSMSAQAACEAVTNYERNLGNAK